MYVKIRQSIYRLLKEGAPANKVLKENLSPHGYFEFTPTPGLWQHIILSIYFLLVVDDFGVKDIDKSDADHLIAALKNHCEISKYWTGELYCGITLNWIYDRDLKKIYVNISMPGYITKHYKNTNKRYQSAPNIHHIPQPQRNTEHQHNNQFKQMTPGPLAHKESIAFKKYSAASSIMHDPLIPPLSYYYQH